MKKIDKEIKNLLGKPLSPYEQFHTKTKIKKFKKDNPDAWPESWKTVYYKGYGRLDEIKLPPPTFPNIPLKKTLFERKSTRRFNTKKKIDISALSSLLYFSCGIKYPRVVNNRFYPSGGSRYPLETYILSLHSDLEEGIYHYYVKSHSLEKLLVCDKKKILSSFHHSFVKDASFIIVLTAVFKRNTNKYGDRGYRHILTEAGHLAQNIYLGSAALNIGCCALGGFIESDLENLMDLDGVNESVIYALAIGPLF